MGEIKSENAMLQKRSILHTSFFLLGFSIIFIALGYSTTFVGSFFQNYQDLIRQIGAILIIFFALVLLGVYQPKFMMKDHTFELKNRPGGYFGSVLIGIAFAAGWTPCTGPILGMVLTLAGTNPQSAIPYMVAYILGFAIPFFILSFFIGKLQWIRKHNVAIVKTGGYIMIVMGIILYFNWMESFTSFIVNRFFGGWTGF